MRILNYVLSLFRILYAITHKRWRYRIGDKPFDDIQRMLERHIAWQRKYDVYFSQRFSKESGANNMATKCKELMPDLIHIEALMDPTCFGWLVRGLVSAWSGRELDKKDKELMG